MTTPYMLAIREAAKAAAERSRIARLFGTFDKPAPTPTVYVRKANPQTRTPAQQQQWDALIAAWLAEPFATCKGMRRRFGCSLSTVWAAREASKELAGDPLRQRKTK